MLGNVYRWSRGDWGGQAPTTNQDGPIFANANGFEACSLGPLDESGGCTLIPLEGPFQRLQLRVGAGAPIVVPISGPVQIIPDYSVGAAAKFNLEHTIDLLFWRHAPPFVGSLRAQKRYDGTLSGSSTASAKMIPCSGRSHVSVIGQFTNPAAEACTFTIDCYMLTGSNSSNVRRVFSKTSPTDLTSFSWSMGGTGTPVSALTGELNPDRCDMILLNLGGTVTTSTVIYSVRATDL